MSCCLEHWLGKVNRRQTLVDWRAGGCEGSAGGFFWQILAVKEEYRFRGAG